MIEMATATKANAALLGPFASLEAIVSTCVQRQDARKRGAEIGEYRHALGDGPAVRTDTRPCGFNAGNSGARVWPSRISTGRVVKDSPISSRMMWAAREQAPGEWQSFSMAGFLRRPAASRR